MDMTSTPTTDEIFALMTQSSRISLATVKEFPHGNVFDDLEPELVVAPDIVEHRLQVGAPTMIAALHSIADAAPEALLEDDELLLIVRRQLAMKNSFGRHLAAGQVLGVNPLSVHPADMDRLHLTSDEKVEISSNHGAIQTVVKKDETLLPGTASLTHGYGSNQEFNPLGANPNRIIPAHFDYNPITGQPRMSAIRVKVRPVPFGD
jgi:anaerobic selenocysteine-containing dehydrogenase